MDMSLDLIIFSVSLLFVFIYLLYISIRVSLARNKFKVLPPKTTGNGEFEKAYRIQVNTYEGAILYIPLFTLVYVFSSGILSGLVVLLWLLGRIIYQISYTKNPEKRVLGVLIQLSTFLISFGIIIVQMIRFFI